MGDILSLVAKRLGYGVITLLVISILIFFAVEALPGDIAEAVLGQSATPETVAAMREQLGLDRPAVIRYMEWLAGAVQLDFGVSLITGDPVSSAISQRFANTLFLAAYAAVIAVPISIILGVIVALLHCRDICLDLCDPPRQRVGKCHAGSDNDNRRKCHDPALQTAFAEL